MSLRPTQNIGFLLREMAKASPDTEAIVAKDLTLSRHKLWQVVECYAHFMRENGVASGDLVSIDTADAIVSIASVFALSLLGARYVPFSAELVESDIPTVQHFVRSVERSALSKINNIVIDHTWSPKFRNASQDVFDFEGFAAPDEVVWIVPSSGTTGRPKYSPLSENLLFNRVIAIAQDYEAPNTRLTILFGCMSRPYIIRAVSALLAGHTIVDTQDIWFCAQARVNFICASPQQIRMWLAGNTVQPKIGVLQVSGAKIEPSEISTLLDSFERVEDVYGSNETIKAHISVFSRSNNGNEQETKANSSFVEVVNELNAPCEVGVKGILRIKTPWMVDRYLDDPKATAEHFKDGWFYPGDLAVWHSGRRLEIIGRESDVVNLGGQKIALPDVEKCLTGVAHARTAACFTNPIEGHENQLAACIEVSSWDELFETVEAAWKACVDMYGPTAAPSVILAVSALPLSQDGVVQRKQALQIFAKTLQMSNAEDLNRRLFIFRVNFDD